MKRQRNSGSVFALRDRSCIPLRSIWITSQFVIAGLDPAISIALARPCHLAGMTGTSPVMTSLIQRLLLTIVTVSVTCCIVSLT
jgi:hypothetical protein